MARKKTTMAVSGLALIGLAGAGLYLWHKRQTTGTTGIQMLDSVLPPAPAPVVAKPKPIPHIPHPHLPHIHIPHPHLPHIHIPHPHRRHHTYHRHHKVYHRRVGSHRFGRSGF